MWPSTETFGATEVIGIRSGIVNLACGIVKDVSLKIFHGVALASKHEGFETIIVQAPLPVMKGILERKLGFVEFGEDGFVSSPTDKILMKYIDPMKITEIGDRYYEMTKQLVTKSEFLADVIGVANVLDVDAPSIMKYMRWAITYKPTLWLLYVDDDWHRNKLYNHVTAYLTSDPSVHPGDV
jgi:hypothetical protein